MRVGDDEWNLTYLSRDRILQFDSVPTQGFEPRPTCTLGSCLTYCAKQPFKNTLNKETKIYNACIFWILYIPYAIQLLIRKIVFREISSIRAEKY